MGQQILEEQATPATPATDKVSIYPKAGGQLYKVSDDGTENQLLTMDGTPTVGAVIIGDGAGNPVDLVAPSALGKVLVDQGSGSDPAYEYRPMRNLLTNSDFGVWSNSTLEDVRNLPDATTTVSGTTCTSTAHLLTKGMLVTDDTDACFEVV